MEDADNIVNLAKDEEIFRTVAKGYLDVRYGAGGQKEKAGQKRKQELKDYVDRHGVDGTVVDSLVQLDEIVCLLDNNTEGLGLQPSTNFVSADRFPDRNVNRDIIPLLNDQRRTQLASGIIGLNVIFTLGVISDERRRESSGHFVAVRVLQDPGTGEIFLLYRDSFGSKIGKDFKIFAEREFGGDVKIVVIENQEGVMQQYDGTTCGPRAVTVMAAGGLFDRVENRIRECGGLDDFMTQNLKKHMLYISVQQPRGKAKKTGRGLSLAARVFRFLSGSFRYLLSSVRSLLARFRTRQETRVHGPKNSKESEKAQEKGRVLAPGKISGKADQKSLEARLGAASDELTRELGKGEEKALTPKFN
ncbi:MAG: hypothetical protein LBU15_03520 [Rickettsiales bacterium]|jgi:hypothetical protein|nr:hypothetical protein [Rickettsiales bacterium]